MFSHKELITKNKKMAEYMDYVYIPYYDLPKSEKEYAGWRHKFASDLGMRKENNPILNISEYIGRSHNNLKFHESWEWLVFLIEKIKSKEQINDKTKNEILECFWNNDIEKIHELLYSLIK